MKNYHLLFTVVSTFILLMSFNFARADEARTFSVKIFAEKGAEARAQEFIDKLKDTEPFKQLLEQRALNLSDSPIVVTTTKCQGGLLGIPRLAKCDMDEVTKICNGADRCPLFTSVPGIGAGGSPSPIASSSFPWTTMLHEFIHTFGFSDEYAYTQSETKTYCGSLIKNHNEIQLKSAQVYKTQEQAIKVCKEKIPWCEEAILSGSKVITKVEKGFIIGSPAPEKCPNDTLGVYLGAGCMKGRPDSTYRPYYCPTVMGFPTIGQDYCEVQERHGVIARMPNILPAYFQLILFKEMVPKSSELNFKPHFEDFPASFSYGVPMVDNLSQGDRSQGNRCSRKPGR